MRVYVIERFMPLSGPAEVAVAVERERALMAEADDAAEVRHLRSTYLHTDELCFSVYEAPSILVLQAVNDRAHLACERITEATEIGAGAVL